MPLWKQADTISDICYLWFAIYVTITLPNCWFYRAMLPKIYEYFAYVFKGRTSLPEIKVWSLIVSLGREIRRVKSRSYVISRVALLLCFIAAPRGSGLCLMKTWYFLFSITWYFVTFYIKNIPYEDMLFCLLHNVDIFVFCHI